MSSLNITYSILPIKYDYLFKEPVKQLTEYLKMIPRKEALNFSLFISNFTEEVGWKEQLSRLPICESIKRECYLKMHFHELELPGAFYVLFTPHTGIELLKNIFTIPPEEHHPVVGEWQHILIKAITLVNSTLIDESPKYEDNSFNLFQKSVKNFRYELDDRIILYGSVYRAMCLLDFFENDPPKIWKKMLEELTEQLDFDSLRDYIRRKLDLLNRLEVHPKKQYQIFRVNLNDYQEFENEAIPFSGCISKEKNRDYTEFKKKPFVQFNKEEFAVIKSSFVAILIYDKLKYALLDIFKKSPDGNAQKFFGTFDTDFIEKILFVRILNNSFNSPLLKRYICLSEDDCKERIEKFRRLNPGKVRKNNSHRLMDGYVRYGNRILLIECKGKIISIEALNSKKRLKNDVDNSLVGDEGTGQLKEFCKRIINSDCVWDNDIPKYYKIYPLLVVDDIGFSANGFNQYVMESTKDFVTEQKSVFPFTVLDMDTFILISELIRSKRLDIFSEIESYHRHIKAANTNDKKVSFAIYLRYKYETRLPKEISKWLKKLYN